MRTWLLLLSGLLVWSGHFLAIYIAGSLFPGTALAKWLTGILTIVALALLTGIVAPVFRRTGHGAETEGLAGWLDRLTLLGAAVSAVAILYQGLPALTA